MSSKRKVVLLGIGAVLIAAISFGATYYYISANEQSEELIQGAGLACKRFYQQEALKNWHAVEIGYAWKKGDSIVVELNAKEHTESNRYIRRLCVMDSDKGTITIPSIRQEGRWEK